MTTHKVKSWPAFFSAMIAGEKKHDFRDKRDRDYKVGDILHLHEYDPFTGEYSGRNAKFRITYITSNETPCAMSSVVLDRNFAVLSVEKIADNSIVVHVDTPPTGIIAKKFPSAIEMLRQAADKQKTRTLAHAGSADDATIH